MNEAQKPFECKEKGSDMTFTNEDHLNLHKRKHDMMLTVGFTKATEVADQTPTPTRFIRNCEEVGLFQDLQNVNPFDEGFKKATESVKNGSLLHIPHEHNDDSLHTPHILPHIEENCADKCKTTDTIETEEESDSNDFPLIIEVNVGGSNVENRELDIKKRIKAVIENKERRKKDLVTVVPFAKLVTNSEDIRDDVVDPREKIKEMNRVAQMRCRKRKQEKIMRMEAELVELRESHKQLEIQNQLLRTENEQLKAQLASRIGTTNTVASKQPEVLLVDPSSSQGSSGTESSTNENTVNPVAPVIIQVVPVSSLAMPFVPTHRIDKVDCQKKVKKREPCKIVPKTIDVRIVN